MFCCIFFIFSGSLLARILIFMGILIRKINSTSPLNNPPGSSPTRHLYLSRFIYSDKCLVTRYFLSAEFAEFSGIIRVLYACILHLTAILYFSVRIFGFRRSSFLIRSKNLVSALLGEVWNCKTFCASFLWIDARITVLNFCGFFGNKCTELI